MNFYDIIILAFAASMDAFAVAVCKGLAMKEKSIKNSLLIAGFFGFFQAFMPLLGYFLGMQFKDLITGIDHYIAFILLVVIGIKMIMDAKDACPVGEEKLSIKNLLVLAFATSIDALAIGITFSFFQMNVYESVSIIGTITFILSYIGVNLGHVFGEKLHSKAEIFGGVVLILIGTKILLEHLGYINF